MDPYRRGMLEEIVESGINRERDTRGRYSLGWEYRERLKWRCSNGRVKRGKNYNGRDNRWKTNRKRDNK